MKDYYEILEVNKHASKEVIEKAYRVLIKKYHPDLYDDEMRESIELKVRDINEAYKILSDDFLREQYDRELIKSNNEKYIKESKKNSNTKFNINKKREIKVEKNVKRAKVGSIGASVELLNEILKNKPQKFNIKNLKKEDWTAIGMTIGIMIVLGIILWFIPFTNGFMRELTVENPLFSWIGKIFQK